MAIRILSSENITGDITTSGKVNAGDRILTEATTSNALLQVKYNSSNYLEGYYDKLNVVGGDFLIQRSGDTKIQLTSVGTTFTNLSNTSAASSSADEVKIGTFGAGRPAIFLGTSNTTYTNSTWFIENIGASGKFRIGRNGLDVLEIENGGASTFKGSSVTVLNASDPSVAVSDTDTNYKGIMTWRNSGSENVLEFVTRYAGTYYTNNLVLDRGNVGIGTSSPDQTGYGYNTLTIMGGTTAGYAGVLELLTPSTDANGQNLGIVSFGSGGTRNAMIGANRDSANNDGRLSFWTSPGSGGIVERMRITSAGAIEIKGSSTSASAQGFITNDNSKLTIGSAVSGSVVKDIQFNSPTPMMYIDGSTASVGIGTTSPGNKLTIATGTGGGSAPDSRTQLYIDKNGEAYISINSPAESFNGIRLSVAGTPKGFMELYDNTAQGKKLNIGTVDARDVVFATSNQPKMTLQASSGNFGIGTTSPDGKLEVAGGTTLGFRLSNAGDSSAYDQVRMTYTGYNSGSPTVTFMPLTTPGGGNVYTTFLFQNTNGVNASSNNNANVAIDGTLQVGRSKGLGETTLIMNNYDTSLAGLNQIQNSIRMSGRYWSGSGSQLVETRINSVHQESDGNGGSALTFMTQTGGSAVVEQMRIDKVGNVGIGEDSPAAKLHVSGTSTQLMLETPNSTNDIDFRFRENGTNKWNIRYQNATEDLQILNQIGPTIVQMHFGSNPAKVGIGNVNPTGRLTVEDDNGNQLHLRHSNTASGRYWNFDVASDSKLYVLNEQGTGVYIAHGATSWTGTSDESLKENIKPLENVLDKIKDYRCVEYNLKNVPDDKKIGFIAQDWKNDFAPIVDEDNDGLLGMKYTETIPVLLKAIQELKAEIELLKNK